MQKLTINIQTLLNESYDKPMLQNDYEAIKSIVYSIKSIVYSIKSTPLPEIEIPSYKVIDNIHFQIYITPGIYELEEIIGFIQQFIKRELVSLSTPVIFPVEADTVTMRNIFKIIKSILFKIRYVFIVRFYSKKIIHLIHINLKDQ